MYIHFKKLYHLLWEDFWNLVLNLRLCQTWIIPLSHSSTPPFIYFLLSTFFLKGVKKLSYVAGVYLLLKPLPDFNHKNQHFITRTFFFSYEFLLQCESLPALLNVANYWITFEPLLNWVGIFSSIKMYISSHRTSFHHYLKIDVRVTYCILHFLLSNFDKIICIFMLSQGCFSQQVSNTRSAKS